MRQKNIKYLFIGFMILLPLHYALVGIVGVIESEPWPALVLPAFKSVFSSQDSIAINQVKFYVENNKNTSLIEVQPEALFSDINKSQIQGFFRTHFSDSATVAAFNNDAKTWLLKRINQQYPAINTDELQVRWIQKVFAPGRSDTTHFTTKTAKQFSIFLHSE